VTAVVEAIDLHRTYRTTTGTFRRRSLEVEAVRGGLSLPTGKQLAYIGEGELRFSVGGEAALNVGQFTLATDVGVMTRPIKTTTEDFVASSEIVWGNGVRYKLPDATRTGNCRIPPVTCQRARKSADCRPSRSPPHR